ncbi:MAG TPA: DEAD/DEAH box helicase, partial [Thermoproteota archaeon]|nr:DEAD/DEAH box helicase [Thermoproteota archaeon]
MTQPAGKSESGASKEDEAVLSLLTDQVRDSILKRGMLPLTEVQRLGIPVILSGRNALLISPTGTGKTEAALIPVFHLMK